MYGNVDLANTGSEHYIVYGLFAREIPYSWHKLTDNW